MKCNFCGREIQPHDRYCTGCGRPIEKSHVNDTSEEQFTSPQIKSTVKTSQMEIQSLGNNKQRKKVEQNPKEKRKKRKASRWIISTLLVVFLASVGLIIYNVSHSSVDINKDNQTQITGEVIAVSDKLAFSSFFLGSWEERFSAYYDPGVFITHIEFSPDGKTVIWNGYEEGELWGYYSGSYKVLEDNKNGTVKLLLNVSDGKVNYQTTIRLVMDTDNYRGVYSVNLSYESGDIISAIGTDERYLYSESGGSKPLASVITTKTISARDEEILTYAKNMFFEVYGLKVEIGAKASDIGAGLNIDNYYKNDVILFPNGRLLLDYSTGGNIIYGFNLRMDDTRLSEHPVFSDPLGYKIGEFYPYFYEEIKEIVDPEMIDYTDYNFSYFRLFFDKDGNSISAADPNCSFSVSYAFEGSYENTVLESICWQNHDINRIINTYGSKVLEPWAKGRVTGSYNGPKPEL